MADLSKLKFNRGIIKSKVTRLQNYLMSLNVNNLDNNTISQLKMRLVKFEPIIEEFNAVQSEIEFAELAEEPEVRITFEKTYYDLICSIEGVINNFSEDMRGQQVNRLSSDNSSPPQQVRLPIINLPNFDGSYDKWLEFRDCFTSLIHNNDSISAIQKFYYLRSCLQGEAAQVIHSMTISVDNYPIAWELIQGRFENKRLVVYNHVRAMFNMSNVKKESCSSLRNLYDTFIKNLRALKSLGQPTDMWDTLLVYLITSKFDDTTNREWESCVLEGDLPSMTDVSNFLKRRCEILEKLEARSDSKVEVNKGRNKGTNKGYTSSYVNTSLMCYYCKKAHTIYNCESFLKLPINSRIEEIKKLKLCINCFKPSHMAQACTSSNCRKCGKRHNSLLHLSKNTGVNSSREPAADTQATSTTVTESTQTQDVGVVGHSTLPSQVLLSTAQILIEDHDGKTHTCRALLDSGSQSNFVTSELCKRLGLQTTKINFTISGVGLSSMGVREETAIKINSRYNSYNKSISALILNKVTDNLPMISFSSKGLNIPSHMKMADPTFNRSGSIDVLLGSNVFWEILCVGQVQLGPNLPVLHKTLFGWVVAGDMTNSQLQLYKTVSCLNVNLNNLQLDEQLSRFWQLEEVNNKLIPSKEDNFCEEHFLENTGRSEDGRFIVRIPLKSETRVLGDSRQAALNRFLSMERRLMKDNKLRNEYVNFMCEYETLGHMTPVLEDLSIDNINYYLPHHAVIREESSTTKIRVVFDASMKTDSGVSLNDIQYSGPTIQSDLIAILLRFRLHEYVMSADISKMYRQILLNADQRHLQRIFWRADPASDITCYELNTITYGTASAPFLAVRCLYEIADEYKAIYPRASEIIKRDFYVDDLLTGASSPSELIQLQNEINTILRAAGFELRKWLCNKPELITNFHINQDLAVNILSLGEGQQNKTLGILWNANSDTIQYSINRCGQGNITKRSILSVISQVFDPLGLLGPVIIVAKILMQGLWLSKLTWDETIPQVLHSQWCRFIDDLPVLNSINIARQVFLPQCEFVELHAFCDASEKAFGACVYIRCKDKFGKYSSQLLCAKSRVAPIKQVSLPRLELCGAVLLARLVDKVKTCLKTQFNKIVYYCDSTITLCWIKSSPSKWKTFVANRTSEIQQLSQSEDWHHVRTYDNPADLISRGVQANTLLNSRLWWHGPPFLLTEDLNLQLSPKLSLENIPEQRTIIAVGIVNDDFDLFSKYSSLVKLQRVTAYCCRFINNLRQKCHERNLNNLTSIELQNSMNILTILCQRQAFPDEYNKLVKNKNINNSSKLSCLNPFIRDKIIRVGGRIRHSNLAYDKKFPIILPSKHNFTKLIMTHEHNRLFHCGPSMLLSSIRERYWPISGRNQAKNIVHNCVICFKSKPTGSQYLMGDLPAFRVTQSTPFFNSGVDYAGPFFVKDRKTRGAKLTKAYVCLFICLATKAIHLELVSDLSTDCFLATLKRFIARRGKPALLLSDNATNFVGANAKLQELQLFFSKHRDKIIDSLSIDNISWKFIPPRSPNFGGIYEAGIKSTKFHLRRVIGNASLTFEEFNTVLSQVEAILNSRPLCPLTSNSDDPTPLTPAHFLIGKTLTSIPEQDVTDISENRLSRYERLQSMIQHFWSRWNKEYVSELQSRVKWKHNFQSLLKKGALVLVKQDNTPPLKWHLGRVVELHPGADGISRVASVKLGDSVVKRAVTKLCALPIPGDD